MDSNVKFWFGWGREKKVAEATQMLRDQRKALEDAINEVVQKTKKQKDIPNDT